MPQQYIQHRPLIGQCINTKQFRSMNYPGFGEKEYKNISRLIGRGKTEQRRRAVEQIARGVFRVIDQAIFNANHNLSRLGDTLYDFSSSTARGLFTTAVCRHLSRTSCALVAHYAFGNGRTLTLSDLNVEERFRAHPSVRRSIERFINEIDQQLISMAQQSCRNAKAQERVMRLRPFTFRSQGATNVTGLPFSELFAVGDSTFFRSARIHSIIIDCNNRTLSARYDMRFSIADRFKDPFDLRERFNVPLELPGGRPFGITDLWEEGLSRLRIPF